MEAGERRSKVLYKFRGRFRTSPWFARCELEETGTSGSSSETPSQVTVSALANFLTGRIVSTPLSLRMLVHHTEGARETIAIGRVERGTQPARPRPLTEALRMCPHITVCPAFPRITV